MKFEIVTCADLDTIPQATNPAMSLWGDYVRDGLITFMVSPPLTVKTTLLSYLLSMWSNEGGNFCGPVAPCHVLYLSEDPAPLWPKRKQALGFGPTASWVFRYNALQMSWQEICDGGCEWVENVVKEYGDVSAIFVVDTLGSFARLENENDAAQVKAAMSKLYPICDIGAAVLATGHTRKSGGRDGNAVLGSTAFAGCADIVLECKRVYKAKENDRRRDLKCWSRWETDTPDRRVKLNPDNCTFTEETAQVAECDGQHAEYPPSGLTWADWAVQAVEKVGHPATREEMLVAWPGSKMGPTRLDNIIRNSLKAGRLLKQGVGVKGKPQRYSSADVSPTLSGAEELNATPTDSNNDSSAPSSLEGRDCERIDDLALFSPPLRLAGGVA